MEGVRICEYAIQRTLEVCDDPCGIVLLRNDKKWAIKAARVVANLDYAGIEHFLDFGVDGLSKIGRNLVLFPSSRLAICGYSYWLVELTQFVVRAPENVSVPDTKLCEFMKLALVRVIFGELELLLAFQEAEKLRRSRVGAWRRLKLHGRSFRVGGSGHVGKSTRCGGFRGGRSGLRGIPGITIVLLDVQGL